MYYHCNIIILLSFFCIFSLSLSFSLTHTHSLKNKSCENTGSECSFKGGWWEGRYVCKPVFFIYVLYSILSPPFNLICENLAPSQPPWWESISAWVTVAFWGLVTDPGGLPPAKVNSLYLKSHIYVRHSTIYSLLLLFFFYPISGTLKCETTPEGRWT